MEILETPPKIGKIIPYLHIKERNVIVFNEDFKRLGRCFKGDSVDFIVTSPRYNAGIEYDFTDDSTTSEAYIHEIVGDIQKCKYLLKEGGHLAMVMAPLISTPMPENSSGGKWGASTRPFPYLSHIISKVDYTCDKDYEDGGTPLWLTAMIPWLKVGGVPKRFSTKVGSRSNRPSSICHYEFIVVWRKGFGDRNNVKGKPVDKKFFQMMAFPWEISPETNGEQLGHPAPFPEELVRRLIYCYTVEGDIVMDPFVGSGTSMKVSLEMGRRFIGNDISKNYLDGAIKRCGLNMGQVW